MKAARQVTAKGVAKWGIGGVAVAVGLLGGVTWGALEASDVAVLETRRADGGVRATHVWYVEPDAELWIEAGAPENGWFLDVRAEPVLGFRSASRNARYRALPVPTEAARLRVRDLLRAKYGLRDRWVGLFVDSSRSVAVQLVSEPAGQTRVP